MQISNIKKILCATSILAIAIFTTGCDDDDNRHAHRGHRPPPPPHHRPHNDNHNNHHNNHDRDHRPPPRHDGHKPHKNHKSEMVGEYSATALNDASVSKGSTYNVDIFEDENGELLLGLPNGNDYPIDFENGSGSVAGGSITKQADGNFVYKDKLGGMWLVEKNAE